MLVNIYIYIYIYIYLLKKIIRACKETLSGKHAPRLVQFLFTYHYLYSKPLVVTMYITDSITLHFSHRMYCGFRMILRINSDYFLKQR
jgi:hypothetical protein